MRLEITGTPAFLTWLVIGAGCFAFTCYLLSKGHAEGAACFAFFSGWTLKPNRREP